MSRFNKHNQDESMEFDDLRNPNDSSRMGLVNLNQSYRSSHHRDDQFENARPIGMSLKKLRSRNGI